MDTRRLITTMLIVGAVMLAFQYGSRIWGPNKKEEVPAAAVLEKRPAYPVPGAIGEASQEGATPQQIVLGNPNKESTDKLALTISNVTAGLDLVQLNVNDYAEFIKSKAHPELEPLILLKAAEDGGNAVPRPYATIGIHVTVGTSKEEIPLATPADVLATLTGEARAQRIHNDNNFAILAHNFVWKVAATSRTEARLVMTIRDRGTPVAQITKVFRIDPASYEATISHEVVNLLADQSIKVAIDQMAALDLPRDKSALDDRPYHAGGLDTANKNMKPDRFNLTHAEIKAFDASNTREIGSFLGDNPLEWVASSGRFFVAITRPLPQPNSKYFTLYDERQIPIVEHIATANVDRLRSANDVADVIGGLRLTGAAMDIAPRESTALPLSIFFGPKKNELLQGDPHAAAGSPPWAYFVYGYKKVIQLSTGGCYSYCTFDFLAFPLLQVLDFLAKYVAFGNYGIAIIILVIIIRALLHPLTRMSQIKMAEMGKKMKDIQPIIEASKKKYAKDKQKQNEDMMRIYREYNVNPAGGIMGCLPMLIQMPIWIAFFNGIRTDLALRHASFVPGWIGDLSAPDATWVFTPFHLPIMGEISALNILPLLLGIVFFVQMKVQTASQPKPADEQQATMQKVSMYMILVFPLFLYNMPSGLNLYYFASTLGGLVDTWLVRKTLKKKGILPATAQTLPTHEERE